MKNLTTALYTLFSATVAGAHNSFYTAIGGRLYDTMAPDGAEMPCAAYMIISDTDDDSFSENLREVYIQFSLFSNSPSSGEVKDMETYLATMLKDKIFTVTGWDVITTRRIQGNGPYIVPADETTGTGRHWQMDVDFICYVSKE